MTAPRFFMCTKSVTLWGLITWFGHTCRLAVVACASRLHSYATCVRTAKIYQPRLLHVGIGIRLGHVQKLRRKCPRKDSDWSAG
jgi:predicted secreted protein